MSRHSFYGLPFCHTDAVQNVWSCIDKLRKIEAETLLLNGYQDEAQDVCVRPFFQHIVKVRWVTLDNAVYRACGAFLVG